MDMYTDDLISREELNTRLAGTRQEVERLENELKLVASRLTKGEQLEDILNRTFRGNRRYYRCPPDDQTPQLKAHYPEKLKWIRMGMWTSACGCWAI